MAILNSVSAYGEYGPDGVRLREANGFDFEICLAADEIPSLVGTDRVLAARINQDGQFEDMLLFLTDANGGQQYKELTGAQIEEAMPIFGDLGCCRMAMSETPSQIEAELIRISQRQSAHEIELVNHTFYDEQADLYNGYVISIFYQGVQMIEKKINVVCDRVTDWTALVDTPDAQRLIRRHHVLDRKDLLDSDDLTDILTMLTSDGQEEICSEIREMSQTDDMPYAPLQYGMYADDTAVHVLSRIMTNMQPVTESEESA